MYPLVSLGILSTSTGFSSDNSLLSIILSTPLPSPDFRADSLQFMACLETVSFEAHGVVRPSIVIPAKLGYSHRHMELELF